MAPTAERLAAIARSFSALALSYRQAALRLEAVRPGEPLTPATAIVYQSCVPYIGQGADALDAAALRMAQAAGIGLAPQAAAASPQGPGEPAAVFEEEARALYAGIQRATELAEEVGDRGLTGDTHPYGDVIYGICLPYLIQAADEMAQGR